jgi:hypothetical protein
MELIPVTPDALRFKPAAETPLERRINILLSLGLVSVVVGLWIYFR